MKMKTYLKNLFTVYTTVKVVGVRNPLVAVTHALLIVLIWCTLLGSMKLDLRKIYQKHCPVHGAVLTKVKGYVSTENFTDQELAMPNPEAYRRLWDPIDIVYPSTGGEGETGNFAIVTNVLITPNQTLSTCADGENFYCEKDSDCEAGYWSPSTQGIQTGRCVQEKGTCEIRGWCPIEQPRFPMRKKRALLEGVKDFTVMLKNTVDFPGCSEPQVKNAPDDVTKNYLKKCRYNRVSDPLCPIFRIGDIVEWSGDNFTETAIKVNIFLNLRWH